MAYSRWPMARNSEGLVFCHTLYADSLLSQVWLTCAGTRQHSSHDSPKSLRTLETAPIHSVQISSALQTSARTIDHAL